MSRGAVRGESEAARGELEAMKGESGVARGNRRQLERRSGIRPGGWVARLRRTMHISSGLQGPFSRT